MWSNPGASLGLSVADLDPALFQGVDGLHLTGYSLLRPGPRPAALEAVRQARAANPTLLFSLDPNPAHLIAETGREWFAAQIADLGPEILFPNLEEGRLLAEADDPVGIVDRLLTLSPLVVLTLGADGCLVGWGGVRRYVPAKAVTVLDTTGAGDAFAAGFVLTYLRTHDPIAAAEAGTAAAAAVARRVGAR
jgi:sugar/nucleoside kinase (ribokinase family)